VVSLTGIDGLMWSPSQSTSHRLDNLGLPLAHPRHVDIYDAFRLIYAIHRKLDQTRISSSVFSDDKGIRRLSAFRWCGELPYFVDKALPWDRVFNRLQEFWSLLELLVGCRCVCGFAYTSPEFLVPISPGGIRGETLLVISMS